MKGLSSIQCRVCRRERRQTSPAKSRLTWIYDHRSPSEIFRILSRRNQLFSGLHDGRYHAKTHKVRLVSSRYWARTRGANLFVRRGRRSALTAAQLLPLSSSIEDYFLYLDLHPHTLFNTTSSPSPAFLSCAGPLQQQYAALNRIIPLSVLLLGLRASEE